MFYFNTFIPPQRRKVHMSHSHAYIAEVSAKLQSNSKIINYARFGANGCVIYKLVRLVHAIDDMWSVWTIADMISCQYTTDPEKNICRLLEIDMW